MEFPAFPLSKRDLVAAMALQGLLADSDLSADADAFAVAAVNAADALLKVLNRPT